MFPQANPLGVLRARLRAVVQARRVSWHKTTSIVLAVVFLASSCDRPPRPAPPAPGVTPVPVATATIGANTTPLSTRVDSYIAVAPGVLRAGQMEKVAVSLFDGPRPASGDVRLALLQNGRQVAESSGRVAGRGEVTLAVPRVAEGDYQLRLSGTGISGESPVKVEEGTLVFVETDKPIYKPGQPIHVRAITLDSQLKPVNAAVTIEVADAKGIKVFKKEVQSDDFGMSGLDVPLSTEPNLGVWKITATAGKRQTQLDVRVERYVLPKYEVKVDLPKDWFLASEAITGMVAAEYSYGKPVRGEVQIKASRYVGKWEEFANVTHQIDGRKDFQIPAVRYVTGVPAAKSMGNVQLEVVVREPATGYEEKTTRLLNIAASPVVLQVIPESVTFKPGLPFTLLVVAQTPDKKPVDAEVKLDLIYTKKDFSGGQPDSRRVSVKQGKAILQVTPPSDAISLSLQGSSNGASTSMAMQSGYSPSGSFIHVEQVGDAALKVGDTASLKVSATREAANFYYEVIARGTVVFSAFSSSPNISFTVSPQMAPRARVLVYQILSNSEVAADYVPLSVAGEYPQRVTASFAKDEVAPGDAVDINVQTDGVAKVGLAAVDRSVFILAENRLNLQQVFAELERLYQQPQVELHEARPLERIVARGAKEVFGDAGVVVLTNKQVPKGQEYQLPQGRMLVGGREAMPMAAPAAAQAGAPMAVAAKAADSVASEANLAEVQRVRQFFPETWVWDTLQTDLSGKGTRQVTAPDSITTWMLRAVALSKQRGFGVAEAQLRVFQPFFVQIDLPYSTIRGEQFPVKVAVYNYRNTSEEFQVGLDKADWFELVDQAAKSVRVGPNEVGGVSFTIRPKGLGKQQVKVTARSGTAADAIVKDLIVEPEGVAREEVQNLVLSAGSASEVAMAVPQDVVDGSARGSLAITGSYMTQSIQGLEKLLQMPFGCGEQNMILFAPNVFVARYLKETGQLKPEVMAKAESMMITGYQRELTYRRREGSYSAFGEQDKEGSLWLTAFVLKTFAQAKGLIFVDDSVQQGARDWIVKQQRADGSFDPVGFVAHQELLGGLKGKTALTAFLAVALREAGDAAASGKAVTYLEGALKDSNDVYALALGGYALAMAKSPQTGAVLGRLVRMGHESDGGLFWGDGPVPLPMPQPGQPAPAPNRPAIMPMPPRPNHSAAIETTAYATLALLESGDRLTAGRAARWLVSQRNAYGGFGSTQDTVVGLQALTKFAASAKSDVDVVVALSAGNWKKEVTVSPENSDVLQLLDVPVGGPVSVQVRGKGQVVVQAVRRYNVPRAEAKQTSAFKIDVDYGTERVEVNDLIKVGVTVRFTPPEPVQAGMVVLDVAVPTGFAPVIESLDALEKAQPKVKRYDVAGRKVIVYIEDLNPEEEISFSFQARALYPVKAQAVTSQAYSYYRPELKGETLGGAMVVGEGRNR